MANITIVQGEDATITIRLDNAATGDPYDLTGATVTLEIPLSAGGCLSKVGTVSSPATSGKSTYILTDTETATLLSGTIGMELLIDVGTDRKIVQFPSSLLVKERIC